MFTLFDGLDKIDSSKSKGGISDGTHSFDELYDHRCLLFLMCMSAHPRYSWFSKKHDDGEEWGGWFICGMDLPTGTITYHLPDKMIGMARNSEAEELPKGKKWDGHTSKDVIGRLTKYLKEY